MLWMIHRVFFGPVKEEFQKMLNKRPISLDINLREKIILIPFIVLIFWMGIFPNHFLTWMKPSLEHLIKNRYDYKLTVLKDSPSKSFKKLSSNQNVENNPIEFNSIQNVENNPIEFNFIQKKGGSL